jgi:hypothetical protein
LHGDHVYSRCCNWFTNYYKTKRTITSIKMLRANNTREVIIYNLMQWFNTVLELYVVGFNTEFNSSFVWVALCIIEGAFLFLFPSSILCVIFGMLFLELSSFLYISIFIVFLENLFFLCWEFYSWLFKKTGTDILHALSDLFLLILLAYECLCLFYLKVMMKV